MGLIKAKYHPLGKLFWDWYIHHIISADFQMVDYQLPSESQWKPSKDKSVLLLANHCSWWDGFWMYELNRLHLRKRFHVMMLEEQLQSRKLLCYAGAYSINRSGARSMLESLQHTAELLSYPNNLVLIFPQGRIESSYTPEPSFQKGVWRVLQQLDKPVDILNCISTIDYFAERKPTLTLSASTQSQPSSFEELKQGFIKAYRQRYRQQGKKAV